MGPEVMRLVELQRDWAGARPEWAEGGEGGGEQGPGTLAVGMAGGSSGWGGTNMWLLDVAAYVGDDMGGFCVLRWVSRDDRVKLSSSERQFKVQCVRE